MPSAMDTTGVTNARIPHGDIRIIERGQVRSDDADCARQVISAVAAAHAINPNGVRVRLTGGIAPTEPDPDGTPTSLPHPAVVVARPGHPSRSARAVR